MTTTATSPQHSALQACQAWDLDTRGLAPLRSHSTAVFVVPQAKAVLRVSHAGQYDALVRALSLTRWLSANDLPVTVPVDVAQPVERGGFVVTLWRHYPQPEGPSPEPEHLGEVLRHLHALPAPPISLPDYRPHASLQSTVAASTTLSELDRDWLLARSEALVSAFHELDSPLGSGLVHGDAYPGNTLWDGRRVRLGDWDEAAVGRREVDIANTFQGVRFGRTPEQLRAFSRAYGHDLTDWPGLRVLTSLRDLHTLGSFIRRADTGDAEATRTLAHRLAALKQNDHDARWSPF
jgi:aminoglycoside phosphotransferase (APT) family kinase protein